MFQTSPSSYSSPRSLFSTTLDFVSRNADVIDDLRGFPPEMGRLIFDGAFTSDNRLMSFNDEQVVGKRRKIFDVFLRAYPDEFLTSWNLSDSLLLINECTDEFVAIIKHVTELDLSSCHLGSSHELFDNMCHFATLKKLSLQRNGLDDLAVRKITLPVKQFQRGPINLEELHLGGNPGLTDKIVPWMTRLKNLRLLQLTATGLTEEGIGQLQIVCDMSKCSNYSISKTVTSGWAKKVVQQLKKAHTAKIMRRVGACSAAGIRKQRLAKLEKLEEPIPVFMEEIILVRNTQQKKVDIVLQSSPKKEKSCVKSDIDWTVFNLYK